MLEAMVATAQRLTTEGKIAKESVVVVSESFSEVGLTPIVA